MASARLAWLLAALAPATHGAPAPDVDGSRDVAGVARFPGSWIVAYQPPTEVRSYQFVIGRVDRSSRDLRVDRGVRKAAELTRVTYRCADGTRLDDVVDHYREQVAGLGGDVAFTCRGRDCGRSTVWANDVFRVKELVAPDAAQFYSAVELGDQLLSIYVVQRGNRRVYAHVDLARIEGANDDDIADKIARRGYAILPTVTPSPTGEVDAAAVDAAASALLPLKGRALFVVCHIDGDAETALEHSGTCAETAAQRLREAGFDASAFGAGPLLPRQGAPARRLELVVPTARR